jgi:hypothetical protein
MCNQLKIVRGRGWVRMRIGPRTFESYHAEVTRKLARSTADLVRAAPLDPKI